MRDDELDDLLGLADGPRDLPPGAEEKLLRDILEIADASVEPGSEPATLLDLDLEHAGGDGSPVSIRVLFAAAAITIAMATVFALNRGSTTDNAPAQTPPPTVAPDPTSCDGVRNRLDDAGLGTGVIDAAAATVDSIAAVEASLRSLAETDPDRAEQRGEAIDLLRLVALELERGEGPNPQLLDDLANALDAWDPVSTACADR